MKNLRLLGVVCACIFQFLVFNHAQAATIYTYTGNLFDTNDQTNPFCTLGDPGCVTRISATLEFSTALGANQALTSILPDAWSISDGVTTITNLSADFNLFALEAGTDVSGSISSWHFAVIRNDTQLLDELSSMRTVFNAGISNVDDTRYCTDFTSGSCSYVAVALNDNSPLPGSWSVSTVPVPAAVWLFGSGLLGLIGLGRRR